VFYRAAVVHGIVAWLDAYGIGANDVANAFGTSVGESAAVHLTPFDAPESDEWDW
jgi:phosphate/sulfate permease